MEYEFDRAIAVREQGPGTFVADLDAGWVVGGGVNGGYVLAVLGNAIRHCLAAGEAPAAPDPVSVSSYFLSPSSPGPATCRIEVLRRGRTLSTVSASLEQEGVQRLAVLATYADLSGFPHDVSTTLPEPELPPLESCLGAGDAPPEGIGKAPLLRRFGTRFDPACVGWAVGRPSGTGLIQGWFKLADDRPLDPIALLMVVDALPPVTFDLGLPGWAPTLELTVHVRAVPEPGWAKVRHYTRNVAGGMFEEDCEVWDSVGRLVAQSRQLALQPRR